MDTSEDELIRRAQAGDTEAFDQVFAPYLPMLLAYCRALCADYHYAQDAVQETAVVAFRNLSRFFPESDFAAWLKAIARRQALAAGRRWRRLTRISERLVEEVYEEPTDAEGLARRAALTRCLQKLPDQMGAVVRSHYFEGNPLAAVAKRLQLSLSAAKVTLFRAREKLRECTRRQLATGGAG